MTARVLGTLLEITAYSILLYLLLLFTRALLKNKLSANARCLLWGLLLVRLLLPVTLSSGVHLFVLPAPQPGVSAIAGPTPTLPPSAPAPAQPTK